MQTNERPRRKKREWPQGRAWFAIARVTNVYKRNESQVGETGEEGGGGERGSDLQVVVLSIVQQKTSNFTCCCPRPTGGEQGVKEQRVKG